MGEAEAEGGGLIVIGGGGGRHGVAMAESGTQQERMKVPVVGEARWARLAAAHRLLEQVSDAPHSAALLQFP